jgi:histidinol phosphatase-like PHP family hydrolase
VFIFNDEYTIKDILTIAKKKNLDTIGIADHVHSFSTIKLNDIGGYSDSEVEVKFGVEADYVASIESIALPEKLYSKFDFIIGANHEIPDTYIKHAPKLPMAQKFLKKFGFHEIMRRYVEAMCKVMEAGINILAHPFIIIYELGIENIKKTWFEIIAEKAAMHDVAIEINNALLKKVNNKQFKSYLGFILTCKKYGCRFTIGSDAHTLGDIGQTDSCWELIKLANLGDNNFFIP